MAPRSI